MNTFTVSFFGHRRIEQPLLIEQRLEKLICKLLKEKEYVEFLVGRDGEFDQLVSSTVRRCRRMIRTDNSAHIWVLPYETAAYRNNRSAYDNYYDEVEVCEAAIGCYYKAAFKVRNENMIERSDLVVCYVERKSGGAYQAFQYAKKCHKNYLNLSDS